MGHVIIRSFVIAMYIMCTRKVRAIYVQYLSVIFYFGKAYTMIDEYKEERNSE